MQSLLTDLRFSLRLLIKSPGFSAIAVGPLALGVNGTAFSLVNGLLLKSLAHEKPEEVVNVCTARQDATRDYRQFSHTEFVALCDSNETWRGRAKRKGSRLDSSQDEVRRTQKSDGTTTWTYDTASRLTQITRPNGTYRVQEYDAASQLRFVKEYTSGNAVIAFEELKYDLDGRSTSQFLHPKPAAVTLPFDNLLYEETGTSMKTYHPDHLGSTLAMTSDSLSVTDRWIYAPFGAIAQRTGSADTLRRAVAEIDSEIPVSGIRPALQVVEEDTATYALTGWLLAGFALLGLLLAAIGLYGVISGFVAQRTNEIGIRMALGAQWRDVLRLVLRQRLSLTVLGAAIGLGGAWWVGAPAPSDHPDPASGGATHRRQHYLAPPRHRSHRLLAPCPPRGPRRPDGRVAGRIGFHPFMFPCHSDQPSRPRSCEAFGETGCSRCGQNSRNFYPQI